jgi:hypothetical protein
LKNKCFLDKTTKKTKTDQTLQSITYWNKKYGANNPSLQ